ncbi:hypothetical protein [Sphingomonas sp. Leaf67]|uniref:hypothetical protein n=1 Tax=Sphingomonas sp. Leaf67 TaxID=1736230 RepID=UPI0012E0CC02|nr:hypothetical protein [Sphingomonas sp. Leaf67]
MPYPLAAILAAGAFALTVPADPLAADLTGEHWTKPVPPQPHRLMADVDPAFEQQVLHISQRQRETYVHQHHQPDHFWR